MVHMGRGAKEHRLAASVWSNPWKVSAVGRDAAVANYKEYLAKSVDLQGLIASHGDTIIEAFESAVAEKDKVANDPSVEVLDSGNEGPPHKLGAAPVGKEPLVRVHRRGEWRDIVDGGGMRSLGKWPISQRRFFDSEAVRSLRRARVDSVEKLERDIAARGVDGRKTVYALALGKFSSSPFSRCLVVECRSKGWRD